MNGVPMPALRFQQIDAFTDRAFAGNPAAVVWVDDWPGDATMAAIAAENNLSETAFVRRHDEGVDLRWFTPTVEVDLCGHATLAAGFAELTDHPDLDEVTFDSRSGPLLVRRVPEGLRMELPALPPFAEAAPAAVIDALGAAPAEVLGIKKVHHADYWLARYESVAEIDALSPDIAALTRLQCNVVCTAPGVDTDFVSRFFAPASGVDEDPVTGSAHCTLAPFWAERLGRPLLTAQQRSARGGFLTVQVAGDRVWLTSQCVRVIEGTLYA